MAEKVDRSKLKICQYGENCYRKNPIHFGEYSHPHIDKIYDIGRDPTTNEYVIPDELFMSAEVIQIQLMLLEKLYPKPVTKDTKSMEAQATKVNAATTSGGYRLGSSNQSTTKVATQNKGINNDASSSSSKAPKIAKTSASSSNHTSNLAKKQKMQPKINDFIPVVLERGRMAQKLKGAEPYYMFLTAITSSKPTHKESLTVTLQEILDESLGEIESSVQINFMVDIGWLLGHYYFAGILEKPLLVLYGDDMPELKTISKHKPQVTAIKINMPTPFATSHTKMMLFAYKDGSMRVVISTANLYEDDWHNRTQGVWISPKLAALPEEANSTDGESETNFRDDLLLYLNEYKISHLKPWLERIRKSDFSSINVFLIASAPGGIRVGPNGYSFGHPRLGGILQTHCTAINEKMPIVCQSSSIGSLGQNVEAWIQHDFLNSLRKDSQRSSVRRIPPFKMIYPSFNNVSNSHDGMLGGGCLPYSKNINDKQPWLLAYLHQWKSSSRHRSQAMPHIKSYTRFNLQEQCVYWFVLTSANLSKAAWGVFNKNATVEACLRISNYEAGVLFLPKFVTGEETFPLGHDRDGVPAFPLPYDVPLTPYGPDDKPFLMDYLH